jgi:flagellar M-ring protein FliF
MYEPKQLPILIFLVVNKLPKLTVQIPPPEASSIRSQQTSETYGKPAVASGTPGALSNQPPTPATAPITGGTTPTANAQANAASATGLTQKDSTLNFEVDKTIRYTQQAMGGLKRLSVAVVVNYKTEIDKSGKTITRALTEIEKTQITDLAREAMGFNKERGDSLNVVNSPFAAPEKIIAEDIPLWKQAEVLQTAKEIGKYLIGGLLLLYLFFGYLKPTLNKLTGKDSASVKREKERLRKEEEEEAKRQAEEEEAAVVNINTEAEAHGKRQMSSYETNMDMAKQLAASDPKIVANVIKSWVSNE